MNCRDQTHEHYIQNTAAICLQTHIVHTYRINSYLKTKSYVHRAHPKSQPCQHYTLQKEIYAKQTVSNETEFVLLTKSSQQ